MARFINIATIHFQITAARGAPNAQQMVLDQFREATEQLEGTGVDLVVTCEGMEAVGQTVATAESVKSPGPMLNAYMDFARRNRCHVAGALKLLEKGNVYNAIVIVGPKGEVLGDYRKAFLTVPEGEAGMSPGAGAKVIETSIGRIGGIICFDLNFEDLLRQYATLKPDVLAFASMFHGGSMQAKWAYECRSFFAAACKDNCSEIRDPLGRMLAIAYFHTRIAWARVNLDRFVMHLDKNRPKFSAIRRQYKNDIRIDVAPDIGVAVLYSESSQRTAADIAREFELESLDDYFEKNRVYNEEKR